jgi:outer membrane lipoprotein SlyB
MKKLATLMTLVMLGACASKPKLYPNETFKANGKKAAEKDVEKCMADAEEYLDSAEGKKILKGAGGGLAIGAAFGAIAGAFTGNLGSGMVRGGAVGAGVGGTAAAISPDQLKRNYVNQCLGEQGYQVIGWD